MKKAFNLTVLVSALGYFVDIFDLIVYGIVRKESLTYLGFSPVEVDTFGEELLNFQMAGFLIGGIFWGIISDKYGRKNTLFGSILLYSIFTFLNAFVEYLDRTYGYIICRFLAGIGLAGELGTAITLAAETLPQNVRTYGTTIIASLGLLGAVFAYFLSQFLNWKEMYIAGGLMGFALLILRFGVLESLMFEKIKKMEVEKGNFLALFKSWNTALKYLTAVLVAIPIWYLLAIYVVFAQEMAKAINMKNAELVSNGKAIAVFYLCATFGDIACGLMSQFLKSRKKPVILWLIFSILCLVWYYTYLPGKSHELYYIASGLFGFCISYWTVFVTIAAEQFGTNIRATVATTAPNFIRGSVIPITFLFREFMNVGFSRPYSALLVGIICFAIAFLCVFSLKETYHKELDYVEEFK